MNKFFQKLLLGIGLFILPFLMLAKTSLAEGEFTVDASVRYQVRPDGITKVIHTITLTNNLSDVYAKSYNFSLENISVDNVVASENGSPLPITTQKDGERINLKTTFDKAVVGKNESRVFEISFDNPSFAQKTGEVWEVSIPKLSSNDSFRNYSTILAIPNAFGLEAYLSPKPITQEVQGEYRVYQFSKQALLTSGVTAGFGAFQVFSFTLNYHLENPLNKSAYMEIALPPDTNMQKLYYSSINVTPDNVYLDQDGNWLAKYILKPRERQDVTVVGNVQIFSGARPFPSPSENVLTDSLSSSDYWQINDPQIVSLANMLKTPQAIYEYVSQNLSYNYDKVAPNIVRIGALGALENPKDVLCMEYTDLFIAIARAAGIPAREINGYAYTENPKIQPLSLVADVLHAWPEYWDKQKREWVQIDPTWGSTTGGVDFFSKLDLRHFTFVIHGADAQKPYTPGSYKLGPNPQKDVFVSFGKLPEVKTPQPILEYKIVKHIPFLPITYELTITNPGPIALYNLKPEIIFDGKISEFKDLEVIPPFGHLSFEVKVPFSFLGKDTPNEAIVKVLTTELDIPTYKNRAITDSFISLSILVLIVVVLVLIKVKKEYIKTSLIKIKNIPAKIFKHDSNNPTP
jgi:hypothetical protein